MSNPPVLSDSSKKCLQLMVTTIRKQQSQLLNHNEECLNLVESMSNMRKSWNKSVQECSKLREQQARLEAEIEDRDTKVKTLQAEVKDARMQVRHQMAENSALKSDLTVMEQRLHLVKDLLKGRTDLPADEQFDFLKENGIVRTYSKRYNERYAPNDVETDTTTENLDYDVTGDSLDFDDEPVQRSGRRAGRSSYAAHARARRSVSAQPHMPSKRSRSKLYREEPDINESGEEAENAHPKDDPLPRKRSKTKEHNAYAEERGSAMVLNPVKETQASVRMSRRSMNRSMSESNMMAEAETMSSSRTPRPLVQQNTLYRTPRTVSTFDLRAPLRSQPQSWMKSGVSIAEREHTFQKISSLSLKVTACDVCQSGIHLAAKPAMKCIDCHQHVHTTCKNKLARPCIPRGSTPSRTVSASRKDPPLYRIQDFCPPTPPMIPFPIIHCVVSLEKSGGLNMEGVYRVPGNTQRVDKVLHELRSSRRIPQLIEVEIIADCIKRFLRELRDPLIPTSSRREFLNASMSPNPRMTLNRAICDLPQPNRDTLAYLIVHWQKIVENQGKTKMPAENIARCVAMTVLGTDTRTDLMAMGRETGNCERVIVELLQIPMAYWQNFLDQAVAGTCVGAPVQLEFASPPPASTSSALPPMTPKHHLSRLDQTNMSGATPMNRSMLGPVTGGVSPTKEHPQLLRPKPLKSKNAYK